MAASGASAKGRATCSIQDPFTRAPQTTADPLDPTLLASFAVLRRAATAADQPPPINALAEQVIGLGRYDPANIRQLALRPGGRRVFLVPGFPIHIDVPPARCLARELRPRRPELVAQQLKRDREPIACVVATSPSAGANGSSTFGIAVGVGGDGFTSYGPLGCPRFRDTTRYENLTTSGLDGGEHTGILPDGIASLRVRFSHDATVLAPVVDNFYAYKGNTAARTRLLARLRRLTRRLEAHGTTSAQQRRLTRQLFELTTSAAARLTPTSIDLLAPDGQLIKTVTRPRLHGSGRPSRLVVPAPAG